MDRTDIGQRGERFSRGPIAFAADFGDRALAAKKHAGGWK